MWYDEQQLRKNQGRYAAQILSLAIKYNSAIILKKIVKAGIFHSQQKLS